MELPYLTMAEIEAKYPNEWVLLDRPKVNEKTLEVLGGHVVLHSSTRGEFDEGLSKAPKMKTGSIQYTGRFDPGLTFAFNIMTAQFELGRPHIAVRGYISGPLGDQYVWFALDTAATRTVLRPRFLTHWLPFGSTAQRVTNDGRKRNCNRACGNRWKTNSAGSTA